MNTEPDWRRRYAIKIAALLPENREDSLKVLDLTRELVDFVHRPSNAGAVVDLASARPPLRPVS